MTSRPWDGRPPRDWPIHPRPFEDDAEEIDEAIDRHPASYTPRTLWDALDLGLVSSSRWFETIRPSEAYL